jgi:hypothetical protein
LNLPEAVARQLREQARQSGPGVAALIRERIQVSPRDGESVYAVSADLADTSVVVMTELHTRSQPRTKTDLAAGVLNTIGQVNDVS